MAQNGVIPIPPAMKRCCSSCSASGKLFRGALILSTFAGAAHELTDALLVNPYDISQLARAIHRALEMPEREQTERMQRMRHIVREHNVYRWAAHLLSDLTEIRIEMAERAEV